MVHTTFLNVDETSHSPKYRSAFRQPTCSPSCRRRQKPSRGQTCGPERHSLRCRHVQQIRLKYTGVQSSQLIS